MSHLLHALARKLGDYTSSGNGWYNFECVWDQHKSAKLGVNLERMRYACLSCHKFGDVASLLAELGIRMEWETGAPPRRKKRADLPLPPTEIPGFVPFSEAQAGEPGSPSDLFLRDVHKYGIKRAGVGLKWMADRGWGFAPSGELAMRLIVPVHVGGLLVNYLARSIYDFLEPKELGGSNANGWWPRSECALGLDQIPVGAAIVLVEGMWDKVVVERALGLAPVVSTLGSHLSSAVAGRLLAKKPTSITFLYDGDQAGRDGTTEGVKLLRKRGAGALARVAVCPWGKDPDELGDDGVRSAMIKSQHWLKAEW